ncbi:MAG: precorrin-6A synthase (deacetylating) [Ilumatobacteraceae bacterium]
MSELARDVPVRRLRVIGIGVGDLNQLTIEAIEAIRSVDVFLVVDKGDARADLAAFRRAVLRQYGTTRPWRTIEIDDPERDRGLPYEDGVRAWHRARTDAWERVLLTSLGPDETGGILVWGDPSLYDSTLRIIDDVTARGEVRVEHDVVPGISSMQLLAARHRIALNRIGRPVHITTGRHLRDGLPAGVDDAVVMLDGTESFTGLVGQGFEIFWGADLGGADEVLVSGLLDDVADDIVAARGAIRSRKGWVFDVYLVRRRSD